MSQSQNPQPSPDRKTPSPTPTEEQVYYDGPPSWTGRTGPLLVSFIIAALLVVVPIILQVAGRGRWWLIAGGIILAIGVLMLQVLFQRSLRYRITNYRIDFQRGVLTRQIDSLELWYVDHINFRQSLVERLIGTGTIELTTNDERMPHLVMPSIPNGLQVFEHLKSSALAAKRQRGLIELDNSGSQGA
jgi:uncharacterized membrane protein YdbT with pleckstrin-like domain